MPGSTSFRRWYSAWSVREEEAVEVEEEEEVEEAVEVEEAEEAEEADEDCEAAELTGGVIAFSLAAPPSTAGSSPSAGVVSVDGSFERVSQRRLWT